MWKTFAESIEGATSRMLDLDAVLMIADRLVTNGYLEAVQA